MPILCCKNPIKRAMMAGTLAVSFAVFATMAHAQSSSAAVTGAVTDSSGARLPGAKVVLSNVETNVARETVSNDAGDYNFVSVPPAKYILAISAPTFQTQKFAAFDVAVDQKVNINAVLKIGDVSTSVTVEAQGTEVESTTSQLGTVMGTKEVNDLPLNGRNFTQLLTLTPGAAPVNVAQNSSSSNTANNSGDQYILPALNGQPNRATLWLVDGLNDNNSWYNTYAIPPIIDTIQEFKINAHNDAQYGQVTGGVVNIATKAGTNSPHGSVWEFVRNNDFDAQTFFPSVGNTYHQNQFGAQAGGPIVIPHLYNGHNKTFFEVGFEGFRYSKASQTYFLQPTAAQLGESTWGGPQNLAYGDFSSASTGVAGNCVAGAVSTGKCQLFDPTGNGNAHSNRPAYVGNQIPVSEMDPHAIAYINAVFSAPITIPGIAPTTDNGEVTTPSRQSTYNYTARIDQHLGTRDFFFFRYSGWKEESVGPSSVPHLFSDGVLPAQQYGATWLRVFNPTLTMQVEYGRTHVAYNSSTVYDIPNIALGIYGMSPAFAQSFIGGITLLTGLSITGGPAPGESNSPVPNETNTHEYLGSITKTIGRHTLQAGGGWDQINYGQLIRQGTTTFSGASTADFTLNASTVNPGAPAGTTPAQASAQTGFGWADFLLDEPNSANKRNVNITMRVGGIGSIYLQDSWRVLPKLTLNYGIRYDRSVWPQYGTDGSIGTQGSIETGDFDFNTGQYILQVAPPLCTVRLHAPCLPSGTLPANVVVALNQKIIKGTKTNIGPRFGLAYAVNSTLAIRAGFGITYDNWSAITQMAQNFQGSWPDIGTLQQNSLNTPGSAAYTSAQNPFGTSSGIYPAATPFSATNVNYFVDPEIKNPYSEQWNVGIEQQIDQHTVASINYVGSESHRLDIGGYYNTGTLSATSFATRQAKYAANPSAYSNGASNNPTGQPYPYTVPNKWDHNAGSGDYHALQMALTRRTSNGLTFNASYTWSKAIDEGMSELFYAGTGASLEDPYNPRGSRGVAGFNVPQQLTIGLSYDLPFGKNKSFSTGNAVADYILGNWEVSTIYIMRSGQNFSVSSGGDIGNTGNANTYERANLVGNPYVAGPVAANPGCTPKAGAVRTATQWFNTCAFETPGIGTLGDSGRNSMMAQTYNQMDASLSRVFPIWRTLKFNLRADTFNALNHPVLSYPGAATTTPSSYGVITSTANNQRLMQFSGKFQF